MYLDCMYVCVMRMIHSHRVVYWHKKETLSHLSVTTPSVWSSCSLTCVRVPNRENIDEVAGARVAFLRELTVGTHFTHPPRASWKLCKRENGYFLPGRLEVPEYCVVILKWIVLVIMAFMKINLAHIYWVKVNQVVSWQEETFWVSF